MVRHWLTMLLVLFILMAGCMVVPPSLTVSLASPADGSSITSLTPTLSWGGGSEAATYRLMVATDSNFQNLVMDVNNIRDMSYTIPSGKLKDGTWYYWRVLAHEGKQVSGWTAPWSLRTPDGVSPSGVGTVRVSATVDGAPWSGSINYSVSGPFTDTDNSVPWNFSNIPAGTYTVNYNYGGPPGASLMSISPTPTQELAAGATAQFVLNFHKGASSSITVNATLNGAPWSGSVSYSLSGPFNNADSIVPQTFGNLPSGKYILTYKSGGPTGTVLNSISPSPTQSLATGSSIVYTMNFVEFKTSILSVTATYNGVNWSGPVQYSISGPISSNYTSVPIQLDNAPAGTYYINYQRGGPPGATLGNITPGQSLILSSGSSAGFVLNYYAQQETGNVVVNATLNGSSWSGMVSYMLSGPLQSNDNQVPRDYTGVPTGTYNLMYKGGGPPDAQLTNITPNHTQSLAAGRTIEFNLNFTTEPKLGTITINATLDGKPWQTAIGSGAISYTVTGPTTVSGNSIPNVSSGMPPGPYTLQYNSGGPTGATLTNISPPSQHLSPGGAIVFTLNFTGQPRGYVTVQATIDGQPWSGQVGYVLQGPYVESGNSTPRQFANAPQGSYSVQYRTGGPPGCSFVRVSPPSQILQPGGNITFVITFHFEGTKPTPKPKPGPMPGPIPGPLK